MSPAHSLWEKRAGVRRKKVEGQGRKGGGDKEGSVVEGGVGALGEGG